MPAGFVRLISSGKNETTGPAFSPAATPPYRRRFLPWENDTRPKRFDCAPATGSRYARTRNRAQDWRPKSLTIRRLKKVVKPMRRKIVGYVRDKYGYSHRRAGSLVRSTLYYLLASVAPAALAATVLATCSSANSIPRGVLLASQEASVGLGNRLIFSKDGEGRIPNEYKSFAIVRENSARQIAFTGSNKMVTHPGNVPVSSSICRRVDPFAYAISPKGHRERRKCRRCGWPACCLFYWK